MKLTATRVRSISEPGKHIDQHGLILRVAPGGSKQWVWRGTIHGKRRDSRDIGLGALAYTPLAEAREIAFEYRRISRRGGDPRSTRTNSGVPTFNEAVEAVIDAHRGGRKNGRSETNWRRPLTSAVSLGRVPVDQITTSDLARVLRPVWHDKPETARKLRTRLGMVMRWAIAEGHRPAGPAGPALTAALPATPPRPSTTGASPTARSPRRCGSRTAPLGRGPCRRRASGSSSPPPAARARPGWRAGMRSKAGYARDFVTQMRDVMATALERGVTIISNAGGARPRSCAEALLAAASESGLSPTIGVVEGDDVLDQLSGWARDGVDLYNMDDGRPFESIADRVISANAYFGAAPVVEALNQGAQIVVTGRVTDTGITVAPMIHHFGWQPDDFDKIASGIVAGHILECGAQAAGGNFTDWREVPNYHRIGYPIATCNIGIIARHPALYPWLQEHITAQWVKKTFNEIVTGDVERFEVPNIDALNFLLHGCLGGGGTLSLHIDAQGKTYSHALLSIKVTIDRAYVELHHQPAET